MTTTMILPLNESGEDWNDYSYHKTLTCVNHTNLRWSTKNPWDRSIFFLGTEADIGRLPSVPECDCPHKDLRVVVTTTD